MDLLELCRLHSHWPQLRRSLESLARREAPRGIILESHDGSADEAAPDIADYLGGLRVEIPPGGIKKADWQKNVERYLDGSLAPRALTELGAERICLVVRSIDRQREWLLVHLKGLMERVSRRPFCCIGTTRDASQMDDSVRSFFHVVRKTGRPRNEQ